MPARENDPKVEIVGSIRPVGGQPAVDDGRVRSAVRMEIESILVDDEFAHSDSTSRYQVLFVAFVAIYNRHLL